MCEFMEEGKKAEFGSCCSMAKLEYRSLTLIAHGEILPSYLLKYRVDKGDLL